jgi:hypothetical protein
MVVSTILKANSLITVDATPGYIWYVSSMSRNFSTNIINVPNVNNIYLTARFILNQESCGYYTNALQINGTYVPIKWYGGTAPLPKTYGIDIETITLVNLGYKWIALAELEHYD